MNNMIIRVVADASDFIRGMKEATGQAQKTGKQIQKAFSFQDVASMQDRLGELRESYQSISEATKGMDLSTPLSQQLNVALKNMERADAKIESISEKQRRLVAMPVANTELAQQKKEYKIQALDWDLQAEVAKLDTATEKAEQLRAVAEDLSEVDWEFASNEGLAALAQEYEQLRAELSRVGVQVGEIGDEASDSAGGLSAFQRAGQKIYTVLDRIANPFSQTEASVEDTGDAAEAAAEGTSHLADELESAAAPFASLPPVLRGIATALTSVGVVLAKVVKVVARISWSVLKTALRGIWSVLKKIGSTLASLLKKIGSSAWNGLKSLGSHLAGIGKKAASGSTGLGKMLSSIKKISIASLAVNVAHAAFGRLKSIVSEYINDNAQLKAQTEALKSSMGQALAPAINLVTNAMSALMPYVVGVSNAVGSLMSSLLGSGWAAAADGAKKTADSTSGAAAAQKEMNKQLLGFDQINRMDSQDSGSSGGSGSGTTSAGVIEPKVPAWLETYKKAFEDTFTSLEFQSASVGGKIGMALNTAVVTTLGLLEGIDFVGIGGSLAGQFNDAVGAVDWSAAGRLVGLAAMALPKTIVGFIQETDWAMVGQSLTDFLTTSFNTVGEEIRSIDWVQIGQSVKTFIDNTDWETIAQDFGRTLGNALGAIGTVIWEVVREPWEKFWKNCKDRADECGGNMIKGVFLGIVDALKDIGNWLWTNIGKPIIDGVKECFGIHSPSTVFREIGTYLMEGLTGGITDGIAWVQEKLETLKEKKAGNSVLRIWLCPA